MNSISPIKRIPISDFDKAMTLLGCVSEDPSLVLVGVRIEDGKITANYTQIARVGVVPSSEVLEDLELEVQEDRRRQAVIDDMTRGAR